MSQYFTNDKTLTSRERIVSFELFNKQFDLKSDRGVFSKSQIDEGTRILLEVLVPSDLGKRVLDLGCGYGVLGLVLAHFQKEASFVLADINERAVSLAKKNAQSLGLVNRVTCLVSDVCENITGTFDSIVINPPIRAGKSVTYAMYEGAKEHLLEGGSLYIVIRKAQGAESASKYIESIFGNISLIKRSRGYFVLKASNNPAKE